MHLFHKFDIFKEKFKILLKQKPIKLPSSFSQYLTILNDPKNPGKLMSWLSQYVHK